MNLFKHLAEKAKEMKRFIDEQYALTAASFNDPVALKTEWKPLKRGGSNFATYSLMSINKDRLEFKATGRAKLLYFAFLMVGIIIIAAAVVVSIASSSPGTFIIFFLVGLIFLLTGVIIHHFGTKPIVFDRKQRSFWIGKKQPKNLLNHSISKNAVLFEYIYALQLISETLTTRSSSSGRTSSYESYELNLVLNDGRRINVIDHGNKKKVREDAETLAKFLDKPVWDAIRD